MMTLTQSRIQECSPCNDVNVQARKRLKSDGKRLRRALVETIRKEPLDPGILAWSMLVCPTPTYRKTLLLSAKKMLLDDPSESFNFHQTLIPLQIRAEEIRMTI